MLDVTATIGAMRAMWEQELNETGRAPQPRGFFELHPETYHALLSRLGAAEPGTLAWHLGKLFPGGELTIDGMPVRRNVSLRPGLVRLVVAARETEIVNVPESFDDENDRRKAR